MAHHARPAKGRPVSTDLTPSLFASLLKAERRRLGISQEAASKACRVTLRTWSKWENPKPKDSPLWITMQGVVSVLGSM